jgi:hypothetical protein
MKYQARTIFSEFKEWKVERGYEAAYTEVRFGKELNELSQAEGAGIIRSKRNAIVYEFRFDILRAFMIRKKKFDDNAF